ncbi:MAG: tetratricopeptide repeat protein [Pseudomonadota bacterium]|nr:tetratricopeptide repeat protein [Pseudomonadota bacterium]
MATASLPAREAWPVWLLAATALAYLNALPAAFQFDDYNIIVDNPSVHSLAGWWQQVFTLRPLLKLGYALNWSSGFGAFGFHAVNLLLHLANVALLWRLSAHFPRPDNWNQEQNRHARLLLLLLFALHPIQSESVTYVSGRSMSQMALFSLAGLLCWLEAAAHSRPWRWRGAALLCFTAAVLSKEVALAIPLLLFPMRGGRRDTFLLASFLAGFLVMAALLLFLAFGYQRLLSEPLARGLGVNLASELNAVFYLLGQLLHPHALNIDPDLPELHGFSPLLGLQLTLLASALVLAWRQRRQWPWFAFGLAWFLLLLLPTHSLIPRLDLASERHLYLAGIGVYWIAVVTLTGLLSARFRAGLLLLLALAGIGFTAARNVDYQNEISLWQATVMQSPGKARAWNNLGYAYRLAGQFPEARAAYREALRHDSGYRRAQANLRELNTLATHP